MGTTHAGKGLRTMQRVCQLAREGLRELEQRANDGVRGAQKEYDSALELIAAAERELDTAANSKIVVHVAGGSVDAVMSNNPNIEVEVFDYDSLSEDPELLTEDGESPDLEQLWQDKTKGMKEIY